MSKIYKNKRGYYIERYKDSNGIWRSKYIGKQEEPKEGSSMILDIYHMIKRKIKGK